MNTTEPTISTASAEYRRGRIAYWKEQARLCERDGRGDLVRICLGFLEEYERPLGIGLAVS